MRMPKQKLLALAVSFGRVFLIETEAWDLEKNFASEVSQDDKVLHIAY